MAPRTRPLFPSLPLLVVLVAAAGASGCFAPTDPDYDPDMQGYSMDLVSHESRTRHLEAWTPTQQAQGNDMGPNFTRVSFLLQCSGTAWFQAKLWDRPFPTTGGTFTIKKWVDFECHRYYTLVIDEQGEMTMYHREQHDGPPYESPISDVPP